MGSQYLERNEDRLGVVAAASGTTDVSSSVIDMQNCDGVVGRVTIATANAGNFLKGQIGNASDGSDMTDVAGSKVVAAANGQLVALELQRVQGYRYSRFVVVRGAATATGDLTFTRTSIVQQPGNNNVTNVVKSVALSTVVPGTP